MGSTFSALQPERKQFVRLANDIPIRYKFLAKMIDLGPEQIHEGVTSSLSGGGCLMFGRIPSLNWIPALLMGKIRVGVNLLLPSLDQPIKALCRVAWVEAFEEGSDRVSLGLAFDDLPKESQDEIMKHIIRTQMTSRGN
ncbi:MAG: PilZ domain-containing protein [Planctomycetota bacterium]